MLLGLKNYIVTGKKKVSKVKVANFNLIGLQEVSILLIAKFVSNRNIDRHTRKAR